MSTTLLSKIVHGTVDFAFEHVVTSAISFFTGRMTRAALTTGSLKRVPGSNFALKRKIIERLPLWKRAIHVPVEGKWITLTDRGIQRDVEYVVQVHDAKIAKRHFDLRIVMDGKAVSWAIPMKGKRAGALRFPKQGEKWMAIRQPDHIVEYNKFEGVIPDGEHGAGTVRIWASGKGDLHKISDGEVHFEIFSGPAKGRFVLVPTKGAQGLIISKKPEAADAWTKPAYAKRDEGQLRRLEQEGGRVAERKVDGASVEIAVDAARLRVLSHRVSRRTGELVSHEARLVHLDGARTGRLDGTRLRAEAWHKQGVEFLSGTLNSNVDRAREIQHRHGPVRLQVFDITHFEGKDVRGLPYAQRRVLYEKACEELASPYIQPVRQTKSNFSGFYDQQVGLKSMPTDGVVVKELSQTYDAKPWVKVKPSDTVDCRILRLNEGQGKHTGRLGALTVDCGGKSVQVGTGFGDHLRDWMWKNREGLVGDTVKVTFHVRNGETTATGPRFSGFHADKSDVGLLYHAEIMSADPYALKSAAGWRAA